MKVLVLSNCPLVESQGSGYVVTGYVRELRALGHEVRAFGPEHFEWMPWVRAARSWRLAVGMAAWVVRHQRQCAWDLVELYGGESWLAVLTLRLQRTKARLVHHSNGLEPRISDELVSNIGHDTYDGQPRRWYQYRGHRLIRQAFTRVDALVTVSFLEHAYALRAAYQPSDRLMAIETALPAEFEGLPFEAARSPVLAFCGGWHTRKGVKLVVEVATVLLRRYPNLQFHLAGVGDALRVAEVFPADVAERVRVSPFISSKHDLREWYRQVAVLLMPSYSESFGLVISEAMACGCAVVASRTGFAASLKPGEEALIVGSYEASAYVEAVDSLLADEVYRQRVARQGHDRVQRLNWADAGMQLERFYVSLLSTSVHPPVASSAS